jgi:hypothetical protein
VQPLFPLCFGILLPLALVGVIVIEERRHRLAALLAPVTVAVGVCVVFFTNARFRMVMLPSLAILGGIGLQSCVVLVRARSSERSRWRPVVVAFVVGVAFAWSPLGGVRGYRIAEIDVNTANLEIAAGQLAPAVARLRGALAAQPEDPQAWVLLGTTLERMGKLADANQAWNDAEGALPGEPTIVASARAFRTAHPDLPATDGTPNFR